MLSYFTVDKLSDTIENIQRFFLASLSSHLNLKFSYSEARIFFQVELLADRRHDHCYKFVNRHLDSSGKGNIDCLFMKRDNFSH